MRDPYGSYSYSSQRGYGGAGLYNLAWAQAVQNKSLNDVLALDLNNTKDNTKTPAHAAADDPHCDATNGNGEVDDEKEEGELEEGEIDGEECEDVSVNKPAVNEDEELEIQVSSIRKVLDNVTLNEAQKSFDIVCARLRSSLESLKQLVVHTWFPSKDNLIQQAFSAVVCVYSVFTSMTPALRDQNKDTCLRLLTTVLSPSSDLFTPDQGKEVEDMIAVVKPPPPAPTPAPTKPKAGGDRQEELPVTDKAILTDSNTLSVNTADNTSDYFRRIGSDSTVVNPSDQYNSNILSDAVNQQYALKVRGGFGPLLDLHKVHDEDSLPSPTSKTTPTLSFFGPGAPRAVHSLHNSGVHPYETDAVKAVSSYQQKFGRSTFYTQERLPSPTPSGEGNAGGADDSNEEVSSFPTYTSVSMTNPSAPMRTTFSSTLPMSCSTSQGSAGGISAAPFSSGTNPVSRPSAKRRDPRLPFLNSNAGSVDLSFCPSPPIPSSVSNSAPLGEFMLSKKSKAAEGPVLDSPAPKRQRNGLETEYVSMAENKVQSIPGSTELDTNRLQSVTRGISGPPVDPRKSGSGTVSCGMSNVNPNLAMSTMLQSLMNGSTTESLQSLLKGIASNTAASVNSSEPFLSSSLPANSSLTTGQMVLPTTAPTSSSGEGHSTAGLQAPSQTHFMSSQDDLAKPRMKPRDPRRALQTHAIQRSGASVLEQPKINSVHSASNQTGLDNSNVQRNFNGTIMIQSSSSQTPALPDIANQFTKNLQNIAEIVSAPQTSSAEPPVPVSSPQSMTVNLDRVSVNSGGPVSTGDQCKGAASRPGEVVPGRPQSQNQWGDVEHLFDGFDDQQKAAIQQERARRIDEQKKMFASRKLCLVLDLDHTLLNSAKFAEVDPKHDEILRKKEEQDREKPRRHLFRFPHMGMWTKLRPGIWNFLEKASNLFELHLYTMGNKLYATEMAKVLDPNGSLFAGRVISRGDDGDLFDGDERVPKSKDLDGVLGMESAVVIIDDSVRVWPHNKLNLIVVERYTYFPCSRRQFGLPGPSLLEIDHDERPEEGTLASSLAVIERIHQNFFSHESLDDLDVRNILASEQRKILGGCRILFSRVFPVGEANPHLHPLWQTAEQFGAVCTTQIDEQVTHVVANSLGTDKVNWAISTGRFVVHPGWVEASALLYKRANEQDFAIKS